jgi:hypothetical protein
MIIPTRGQSPEHTPLRRLRVVDRLGPRCTTSQLLLPDRLADNNVFSPTSASELRTPLWPTFLTPEGPSARLGSMTACPAESSLSDSLLHAWERVSTVFLGQHPSGTQY